MTDDPVWSNESPASAFPDSVIEHFAETGLVPYNQVLEKVTIDYLDSLDPDDPPQPKIFEQQLLATINAVLKVQNTKTTTSTERHSLAKTLTPWQIAQALVHLHHTVRIAPASEDTDREYDVLAMYVDSGRGRGTYTASEDDIRTAARRYDTGLTLGAYREVEAILKEVSPRMQQSMHRDLIAVRNGIVHYGTEPLSLTIRGRDFHFKPKAVHPFDPALVFLAKSQVDYVEDAPEQFIHNDEDGTDWDLISWINELFDEDGQEGMADLIWEVIGASLRPHVSWGKTAWFYSEAGSNGKGTLCSLMRNLIGSGAHTSIPLSDFGKDFALEPLLRALAIIVDENDVGTFIDKAANLKAIVTNDIIQINRKYRAPIAFQFHGFMVQCLNEFPSMKDKSESFYRRQLFVPFSKSFTGAERKYIKDDYLQRKEVLEFALWYVINRAGAETPGCYYELSAPLATQIVLDEYKETNDPVRAFWLEFKDKFVWDLLPFSFLYDLYKAWFAQVSPSGSAVSRQRFVGDLVAVVRSDEEWSCPDKNKKHPASLLADTPEHLIAEYELIRWYGPSFSGPIRIVDRDRACQPILSPQYRGIRRATSSDKGA